MVEIELVRRTGTVARRRRRRRDAVLAGLSLLATATVLGAVVVARQDADPARPDSGSPGLAIGLPDAPSGPAGADALGPGPTAGASDDAASTTGPAPGPDEAPEDAPDVTPDLTPDGLPDGPPGGPPDDGGPVGPGDLTRAAPDGPLTALVDPVVGALAGTVPALGAARPLLRETTRCVDDTLLAVLTGSSPCLLPVTGPGAGGR